MSAPTPDSDNGFATIRPVSVTPTAETSAVRDQAAHASGGIPARTVLVALAALLVLGGLLIVGLPWLAQRNAGVQPGNDSATGPAGIPVIAAPSDATASAVTSPTPAPWDDPAMLAARAAAQELAATVAERREDLEDRAVRRWADGAFSAALDAVASAAASFDAREFIAAETRYRDADDALRQLQAQAGDVLDDALARAEAALQAGEAAVVNEALELASAIDAADTRVAALRERLDTLPEVLRVLTAGGNAENAGQWAEAAARYKAALALDGEMQRAKDGAARVAARLASARFQAAMSDALQALDVGRLDAAEQALNRAAAERSRDPAVAAARTRLAEARRDRQLRDLLDQAQAAVADERWAQAVTHYEAVQKVDPHHSAAQTALRVVLPRAEVAAQLAAFIEAPQRLSSTGVRDDAARTLTAARALSPPGDRIKAQIIALQQALDQARTPVAVRLRSDNATEVTVFRVGEQGRFSEKALELLPGRYVAVGARSGYRDVRVEFEVTPGQPVTVAVRAEERL